MPQEKNTLLRIVVPIAAVALGIAVAASVFKNTGKANTNAQPANTATNQTTLSTQPGTPPDAQTSQQVAQSSTPAQTDPAAAQTPTNPSTPSTATPTAPTSTIDWPTLHAQTWASTSATSTPLGSLDPSTGQPMQIAFSPNGSGIDSLELTNHFTNIKDTKHVTLQAAVPPQPANPNSGMVPFSAMWVDITPAGLPKVIVPLIDSAGSQFWKPLDGKPGHFEALIVDAKNQPVLRITRAYSLTNDSGSIGLAQDIVNLTSAPMAVTWHQMAQVDLPQDAASYGGDKRRLRFGHLMDAGHDPTRAAVVSDDYVIPHDTALGSFNKTSQTYIAENTLWPNQTSINNGHLFVWAGLTNRYFSVATFPWTPENAVDVTKTLHWVASVVRVYSIDPITKKPAMGLRLDSNPIQLDPNSTANLPMCIYAGSSDKRTIQQDPLRTSMGLDGLILYNFGGPCGFCTFGWLTGLLIGLLRFLHDYVVFDWAVSIILLVVCVRTILHPVTKWSQVRMQRFGKQMAAMQPKQKEIQEKYKDDPVKSKAEMTRLWREEGVNPAGMLGCLPMFLQTPVWIALYATLYFAFELRHQGAFYGVFQNIQPTSSPFWQFLGDLAEPDRLIHFSKTIGPLPILGPIESFNLLPLILGVVFFIQQKYLTPPTSAPATPEMELQQTMMKWMMVIMFPLLMYNAPSGLAIYFTANSILGILESKWIRRHIEKHGLLDLDKMKAQRTAQRGNSKGGESFLERIQRVAEERQKQVQRDQLKKK